MPWGSRTPARRLKKQHRLRKAFVEMGGGLQLLAKKEHVYVRAANELGAELIKAVERCANRPKEAPCRRCGESSAAAVHRARIAGLRGPDCDYFPGDAIPPCACEACQQAQLCLTINRKAIEEILAEELRMVEANELEKPDAVDASAKPTEEGADGKEGASDAAGAVAPAGHPK